MGFVEGRVRVVLRVEGWSRVRGTKECWVVDEGMRFCVMESVHMSVVARSAVNAVV